MLGKIRNFLIVCVMTTLAVLSLVGSVTSTLTWFTFVSSNSVSFTGTTILSNKQLQVGILVEPEDDTDYEALGLSIEYIEKDTGEIINIEENPINDFESANVEIIAWSKPGKGLSNNIINASLEANGYAIKDLRPVTSRQFLTGQDDNITIYGSPYDYIPDNVSPAMKEQYCLIPLCFRVINQVTGEYCKDKEVWVSDADIEGEVSDGFRASDGVRVHFKSDESNFILNPCATESGKTAVSGLLDLDNDGYYDYTYDKNSAENYEIIFGDYGLIDNKPITYSYIVEDTNYVDINKTGKENPYIFYSKHRAETNIISSYEDNLEIRYAEYESVSSAGAEIDEVTGQYTGGIPVCKTGNDYVGHAEMCIWIEGWDLAVVNQVRSLQFNLGLQFEINKI